MTRPNYDTKLFDWYVENFPDDDLGASIDTEATFDGLYETLDCYRDVYEYIGVGDSIVRERMFTGLALLIGVDYGYVYDQWMMKGAM